MKIFRCCIFVGLMASLAFGDEPEPAKFYRIHFIVKEVEGTKVLNSRACTALVASSQSGSIRNDIKMQVASGPNSYQVVNVGINFDYAQVKEIPGGLSMSLKADVSSIPQDSPTNTAPVIRTNQWHSTVIVPLSKAMIVFSSDDITSKHTMEVELTATPVK